jgi:AraC family transcriptional regulator
VTSNSFDKPFPPDASVCKDDLAPHRTVYVDTPNSRIFVERNIIRFENTNVIVRAQCTQNRYEEHPGPLSILFAGNGQEEFEIDGRRFVVDDSSYLIHNLGQRVSSVIDSDTEVDSFVIGFWPGFAEDVLHSLVTPADRLLDSPKGSRRQTLQFFNQLYRHDRLLSPALFRIRAAIDNTGVTHGWLEEQNHLLLERLLLVHRNIGKEIENLPAVRASTRSEIYYRLHCARDFMEASLDHPLSIPEIAAAAWFSPHHFLRLFKQVFGETPHQYLTRRRLERAQYLLTKTDRSVTDICFALGFESLGSFSWLFRKRMGISPEQFRNRHKLHASLK